MNDPFRSPLVRLIIAYAIGINVFGLVIALSLVLGSALRHPNAVGLVGLLAGIALGSIAGQRIARALKTGG